MRLDALLRPARWRCSAPPSARPSDARSWSRSSASASRATSIPINPKYETLLGRRCYPSIADLPAGVDVPRRVRQPRARARAHAPGRRARDRRRGDLRRRLRREAATRARACRTRSPASAGRPGSRFCGPNCMGVVNPHDRSIGLHAGAARSRRASPATSGLISQSGSICIGLARRLPPLRLQPRDLVGQRGACSIAGRLTWST